MENNNKSDMIFCSFCGINNEEAKKIILGPGVYICNECIEICCEILEETGIKKRYCYNKDTEEFLSAYIDKEVEESEIDKYRNLVIRTPRDADLLFQLGKRYLLRRYYPEANECFKAADKICNDSDEVKFYPAISLPEVADFSSF